MSDYSKLTKDEIAKKLDDANKELEEVKANQIKEKVKSGQASQTSVYERLSKINVKPYLEKAGERYDKATGKYVPLNYLPWAKAWGLVKAIFPTADYKLLEYPNFINTKNGVEQAGTLDYRVTKAGCEVGVTVVIEGESHTQRLYPMDQKNKPINNPNIAQINKAQMRALVKTLALFGLGLDVYAGEDVPSNEDETFKKPEKKAMSAGQSKPTRQKAKPNFKMLPDDQLKNYTVMYKPDSEAKSMKFKLSTIFTFAMTGDQHAQEWFREKKAEFKDMLNHKSNTQLTTQEAQEIQAVAQFRDSKYATEIKQGIEKEKAAKKIKEAAQKAEA